MQIEAFGIDLRVLALQLAMLYTLLYFGKVGICHAKTS